ncbi:type IV secretion system DNA-binding domain-containing protein [Candidatus Peregrinibacteria bacterium]|nr:type IV secretion system DNA-binding domain-containing protein [Candidatus Peregrinibacteria bacterium]
MKLQNLFTFRLFFLTLLVVGVSLLKWMGENADYNSIWEFLKANPIELIFDIFWIYFELRAGMYILRWWYHERKVEDLVFLEVKLNRSDAKVDYEKKVEKDFKEKIAVMAQFYRALTELTDLNLIHSIKSFIWDFEKISFELVMKEKQLSFYVVCDEYFQSIVEKQITTFYPSADIEATQDYEFKREKHLFNGFYMYLKEDIFKPILMYREIEEDPLNDLSNVFSKLEEDETAVIQMIVNPIRSEKWRKKAEKNATDLYQRKKTWNIPILSSIPILGSLLNFIFSLFIPGGADNISKTNAPGASGGDHFIRMIQPQEEAIKRMGTKAGQPGFDTTIRVMACAKTAFRVEDILNNLVVAFSIFKDSYNNWFQNRRIIPMNFINAPLIYHGFKRRLGKFYFGKISLMVPDELATIFHFPDAKYNTAAIIKWLKYKVLPPPPDIPQEGQLLGLNSYRGQKTKIFIKHQDRSRHMYIIGKSGSGKSALISFLARQDAEQGKGFCVVDPHGDLVEDILEYIPKERARDVIIFNPSDIERPMGLNLLEAHTPEEKDRASLDAMEIFLKLFGNEIFGPRIQHYFRNGCLTLMDDEEEGATLIDIPRLFVDDEFQKYKVSKCRNTVVKQFWENEMAKTGAREKEEMIPYFSSKFGPFITNTTMRNIIGQQKSAFNIRQIMDEGKILLVNLSKGKIGDVNAQLLGLIFVNKIAMAALSRADIPERKRKDFYLYVDEFQNFATDAFADILSEARKYHLALIMAHQYIAQLQETHNYEKQSKVKEAVFGNVGTMITFKVGAEDAEYFAKEYAPTLSDQDILGVSNYKAYLKLNIDNASSRPFSLETIWDVTGKNQKVAEIIREYSRMKYGRKREFVDKEIEARLGMIE